MQLIDKTYKRLIGLYSPYYYFALFVFASILLSLAINTFILTDEVFYKSYAERYSIEKIQSLAETISEIEWFIYLLTPVFYLFKFFVVAIVLSTGDFLFGYKIGFKKMFQIAMVAELVFLLPDLIKIVWFLFFEQAETIKQVGSFEFLSIYSLFKNDEIYNWLKYPFSVANVFELIYWLVLALGIKYVTGFNYDKSLKFILSTYVPVLIVWVMFIMFLSIM